MPWSSSSSSSSSPPPIAHDSLTMLSTTSNPAPTPPPPGPLPALPPPSSSSGHSTSLSTSSSNSEFNAPLLNLSSRSVRINSLHRLKQSQPPSALSRLPESSEEIGWNLMNDEDPLSPMDNDKGEPRVLFEFEHSHRALDRWHNNQDATHSPHASEDFRAVFDSFQNDLQSLVYQNIQPTTTITGLSLNAKKDRDRRAVGMGRQPKRSSPKTLSASSSTSTSPSATTPVVSSPRNSIASDLISLSETSRSLQNLSKRLSGSYLQQPTVDANLNRLSPVPSGDSSTDKRESYDPFEYDRFEADSEKEEDMLTPDDVSSLAFAVRARRSQSIRSGSSNESAKTTTTTASSSSAPTLTHEGASSISLSSIPSTASFPSLKTPSSPSFPHRPAPLSLSVSRPSSSRSSASVQDLKKASQDLADRRANLDARRAELLGLPPPAVKSLKRVNSVSVMSMMGNGVGRSGSPQSPISPTSTRSRRSPTESEAGGEFGAGESSKGSIRSGYTMSTVSSSSTVTARPSSRSRPGIPHDLRRPLSPGSASIMIEPPSASPSGRQTFGMRTPPAAFNSRSSLNTLPALSSPSSMTFGGDCQDLPPPSLQSEDASASSEPSATAQQGTSPAPPPVPTKDFPVTQNEQEGWASRAASATMPTRRRVSRAPDLSSPTSSSQRLSHASSSSSLTPKNFSYPANVQERGYVHDASSTATSEFGEVEEPESRPSSYYYSAPTRSARSTKSSTSSGASRLVVEGSTRVERDRALSIGSNSVVNDVVIEEGEQLLDEQADHPGEMSDDSSLDLHTPLPDMLVRAGVLSSRSALIASGGPSAPSIPPKDSTKASVDEAMEGAMSKEDKVAALAKGVKGKVISRNRLVRHRDGKNLGLGLGLTTGLGWSDSEDEDAPSPLRHHLSQIIIQKKSSQQSFSSLASSASVASGLSNFGPSRRESVATTVSNSSLRNANGTMPSALKRPSTSSSGPHSNSASILRGSQSLVHIPSAATPMKQLPRHASIQANLSSQSQQTRGGLSISQNQMLGGRQRSPSTSTSSSSAAVSPLTPATSSYASSAGNSPAVESAPTVATGNFSPTSSYKFTMPPAPTPRKKRGQSVMEQQQYSSERPEVRRTQSSSAVGGANSPPALLSASGSVSSTPRPRTLSRPGSSAATAMPPPSSFPRAVAVTPQPSSRRSSNNSMGATPQPIRKRTISSSTSCSSGGKDAGNAASSPLSIPMSRARADSVTSSASAAVSIASSSSGIARRTKSSASLKNAAREQQVVPALPSPPLPSPSSCSSAETATGRPSLSLSIIAPPPALSDPMTVGSLSFPSPPPLSPSVVNMRMARAQMAIDRKGSALGVPAYSKPPSPSGSMVAVSPLK
ncbi:hypothetical protein FRB97_006395 [Tulasnella sp. 331]|nr:hypothetical protein FRB97_006395 [Tulasnella sp. 331]